LICSLVEHYCVLSTYSVINSGKNSRLSSSLYHTTVLNVTHGKPQTLQNERCRKELLQNNTVMYTVIWLDTKRKSLVIGGRVV